MELTQCINYLLTTAQHAVFQKMSSELSHYGITPVQYGVLYCLWKLDKHNQTEIAEQLKLESSTISGVLDRMEKKGLIVRTISMIDRRFIQIDLTEKGAALQDDVLQSVDNVNREVMKVLLPEDQNNLKNYLRTVSGIAETM